MLQKIYSKMYLVSCTNSHHDVTDLVNQEMVENTKTWISWKRIITFLVNEKLLNLCHRWHILRSYRFGAELTFKKVSLELKNLKTNKNTSAPYAYTSLRDIFYVCDQLCQKANVSLMEWIEWDSTALEKKLTLFQKYENQSKL